MKKYSQLPLLMSNQLGFTLVESSLVVLLLGILLFLTGAHARFLHRLLVRTELEHLATTCYYLQRKAMITRKPQRLTLEPERKAYRYGMTRHFLPAHVCFGYPDLAKGPPAYPDHLITKPISFKGNSIVFSPTAIIQAGTIYLTDSLHHYSYALSCGVAQVSYLRKYQYGDNWELL